MRSQAAGGNWSKSVWSGQIFGTLGRVIERDDYRRELTANCAQPTLQEDSTNFQYDLPYAGGGSRYLFTAGRATAVMTRGSYSTAVPRDGANA